MRHRVSCSLLAALVVSTIPGCGRVPGLHSSAAPPTVICGTRLNDTAAGAVVTDATRQHGTITAASARGLLFIRVSPDCTHGVRVTWRPAAAATLVEDARTTDGLDAAVVLRPTTPPTAFTLTAERNGSLVAHVSVHLTT